MLVHRRATPSITFAVTHLYTCVETRGRHCESEVSYPRTQHNVPGQGSNLNPALDPETCALTMRPPRLAGMGRGAFIGIELGVNSFIGNGTECSFKLFVCLFIGRLVIFLFLMSPFIL